MSYINYMQLFASNNITGNLVLPLFVIGYLCTKHAFTQAHSVLMQKVPHITAKLVLKIDSSY